VIRLNFVSRHEIIVSLIFSHRFQSEAAFQGATECYSMVLFKKKFFFKRSFVSCMQCFFQLYLIQNNFKLVFQSLEQQYLWRYDCALAAARVAVTTDPNLYPEQVSSRYARSNLGLTILLSGCCSFAD
jgi:hypothetical protein